MDARHASGRGQIGCEFMSGNNGTWKPSVNFYGVRASRGAGEDVEGFLRGALAIDTFKKGGTIEDAIQRINKVHFDYEDLSTFERSVVKRVIPFYTWTRRNMPLQVEMLAKRPSVYEKYNAVTNNLAAASGPDESIIPSYFSALGAFKTPFTENGSRIYGTADPLPIGDISGNLFDYNRYLSMVAVPIKLPLELKFGKQVFKDLPLGQRDIAMPAILRPMEPILKGLGVARETKAGTVMNDEVAYAIESIVPSIAKARRVWPGDQKSQDRLVTNWLNLWLNLGLRANTPAAQKAEIGRRKALAKAAEDKAQGKTASFTIHYKPKK